MKNEENKETKQTEKTEEFDLKKRVEEVIESKPWAIKKINEKVRNNFNKYSVMLKSLINRLLKIDNDESEL
jgi:hypothetical protein